MCFLMNTCDFSKAANYASTKAKQKTLFAFVVLEFKL